MFFFFLVLTWPVGLNNYCLHHSKEKNNNKFTIGHTVLLFFLYLVLKLNITSSILFLHLRWQSFPLYYFLCDILKFQISHKFVEHWQAFIGWPVIIISCMKKSQVKELILFLQKLSNVWLGRQYVTLTDADCSIYYPVNFG